MRFLGLLLGTRRAPSARRARRARPVTSTPTTKQTAAPVSFSSWVSTSPALNSKQQGNLPGRLDKDYTWPVHSSIERECQEELLGFARGAAASGRGRVKRTGPDDGIEGIQHFRDSYHDVRIRSAKGRMNSYTYH